MSHESNKFIYLDGGSFQIELLKQPPISSSSNVSLIQKTPSQELIEKSEKSLNEKLYQFGLVNNPSCSSIQSNLNYRNLVSRENSITGADKDKEAVTTRPAFESNLFQETAKIVVEHHRCLVVESQPDSQILQNSSSTSVSSTISSNENDSKTDSYSLVDSSDSIVDGKEHSSPSKGKQTSRHVELANEPSEPKATSSASNEGSKTKQPPAESRGSRPVEKLDSSSSISSSLAAELCGLSFSSSDSITSLSSSLSGNDRPSANKSMLSSESRSSGLSARLDEISHKFSVHQSLSSLQLSEIMAPYRGKSFYGKDWLYVKLFEYLKKKEIPGEGSAGRPYCLVLLGDSGSGKSHFCCQLKWPSLPVSSDASSSSGSSGLKPESSLLSISKQIACVYFFSLFNQKQNGLDAFCKHLSRSIQDLTAEKLLRGKSHLHSPSLSNCPELSDCLVNVKLGDFLELRSQQQHFNPENGGAGDSVGQRARHFVEKILGPLAEPEIARLFESPHERTDDGLSDYFILLDGIDEAFLHAERLSSASEAGRGVQSVLLFLNMVFPFFPKWLHLIITCKRCTEKKYLRKLIDSVSYEKLSMDKCVNVNAFRPASTAKCDEGRCETPPPPPSRFGSVNESTIGSIASSSGESSSLRSSQKSSSSRMSMDAGGAVSRLANSSSSSIDLMNAAHLANLKDIQSYILMRLAHDAVLKSKLAANKTDAIKLLDLLLIKSSFCVLYVEKILDLISLDVISVCEIARIPATLNGLYLFLIEKIVAHEPAASKRLNSSIQTGCTDSSNSLTTVSVKAGGGGGNGVGGGVAEPPTSKDLFYAIVGLFLANAHFAELNKVGLYEILQIRFPKLNYELYSALFSFIRPIVFAENRLALHLLSTQLERRKENSTSSSSASAASTAPNLLIFHSSLVDWLTDVKFCTPKYQVNLNEANLTLALFYLKQQKQQQAAFGNIKSNELAPTSGWLTLKYKSYLASIRPRQQQEISSSLDIALSAEQISYLDLLVESSLLLAPGRYSGGISGERRPAKSSVVLPSRSSILLQQQQQQQQSRPSPSDSKASSPCKSSRSPSKRPSSSSVSKNEVKIMNLLRDDDALLELANEAAASRRPQLCLEPTKAQFDEEDDDAAPPMPTSIQRGCLNAQRQSLKLDHLEDLNLDELVEQTFSSLKHKTALFNLIAKGDLQAIKTCMAKSSASARGLLGTVLDAYNQTGLLMAAKMANAEMVDYLAKLRVFNLDQSDDSGWSALRYSAHIGNDAIVRILLENGASVNASDHEGRTALWAAVYKGHESTVKLLLSFGANINTCNSEGRSVLHLAISMGNMSLANYLILNGTFINHKDSLGRGMLSTCICSPVTNRRIKSDMIRLLIKYGAQIEQPDKNGQTPLVLAAKENFGELVEVLYQSGADVDAIDAQGHTALTYAIKNNSVKCVEYLLRKNAATHILDSEGRSVLSLACRVGAEQPLRLLMNRGLDELHRDNYGKTPLHEAAASGHYKTVQMLLDYGSDVNACDNEGKAPLFYACQEGHLEVAKLLALAGSDVNARSHEGSTPFRVACLRARTNICEHFLREKLADVNQQDLDGRTALFCLVSENKNADMMRLLLENGASVKVKDAEGRSCAHVAAQLGDPALLGLVLNHGAVVDDCDSRASTPLLEAVCNDRAGVVRLLLDAGASLNHRDVHGNTALSIASQRGNCEIVSELLKRGAQLNASLDNPVELAELAGQEEAARLLKASPFYNPASERPRAGVRSSRLFEKENPVAKVSHELRSNNPSFVGNLASPKKSAAPPSRSKMPSLASQAQALDRIRLESSRAQEVKSNRLSYHIDAVLTDSSRDSTSQKTPEELIGVTSPIGQNDFFSDHLQQQVTPRHPKPNISLRSIISSFNLNNGRNGGLREDAARRFSMVAENNLARTAATAASNRNSDFSVDDYEREMLAAFGTPEECAREPKRVVHSQSYHVMSSHEAKARATAASTVVPKSETKDCIDSSRKSPPGKSKDAAKSITNNSFVRLIKRKFNIFGRNSFMAKKDAKNSPILESQDEAAAEGSSPAEQDVEPLTDFYADYIDLPASSSEPERGAKITSSFSSSSITSSGHLEPAGARRPSAQIVRSVTYAATPRTATAAAAFEIPNGSSPSSSSAASERDDTAYIFQRSNPINACLNRRASMGLALGSIGGCGGFQPGLTCEQQSKLAQDYYISQLDKTFDFLNEAPGSRKAAAVEAKRPNNGFKKETSI